MKSMAFLGLWLYLLLPSEAAPVLQKVMSMLESLKETSLKEKHEEEKQYAAYSAWCDQELATKARELGELGDEAKLLAAQASASASGGEAEAMRQKELGAELQKWQLQRENATLKRQKEAAIYKETHQDYTESISAITKATRALKLKGEASSFLTIDAKLAAFLSLHDAPLDSLDFSSDRIEEMLNQLRDRFTDERSKLEKEELSLHHAQQLQLQQLTQLVAQGEAEAQASQQRGARLAEALGAQRARLGEVEAAEKEMKVYLDEVKTSCSSKAKAYEERQAVRAGELSALQKATELLGAEALGRTQGRVGLVQGTSLVALRGDVQLRAAEYLQEQGAKFNSRVLLSAAMRLSSGADPMANVRKMLNNLITTLQTESTQEMEHREWCDSELKGNKAAREEKEKHLELTQTDLEVSTSAVAKLGESIAELTQQLSEDEEALKQQSEARKAEEAENQKTLEDAKEAQKAVAKAIEVLRKVYSEAISFVERSSSVLAAAPEIFEGAYSPQGGQGVIAMLEVVQSDYAKLSTTTSTQEAEAKEAFKRLTSEMAILKVSQQKDLEHKKAQKVEKEQQIVAKKADLQDAEKELAAAEKYHEQLKDSCLASGSTAQERMQRRREEIESLKEAMTLLEAAQ